MSRPDRAGEWTWLGGLGERRIEFRLAADGRAELWLDGVVRKTRCCHDGRAWLWTNVELPFEMHHLVQVKIAPVPARDGWLEVRISVGQREALAARLPTRR